MDEPPLPASTMVPALVRQVSAAGGFATVLHRGSQWGAAMLIVHRRGAAARIFERLPSASGEMRWQEAAEGDAAVDMFIEKQRRFDPDIWVVELDIVDAARFVPGFPPGN